MNASLVLQKWQISNYDGDYDKYFLVMSKKFRNIYPYSIYVLNKKALIIQHCYMRFKERQQQIKQKSHIIQASSNPTQQLDNMRIIHHSTTITKTTITNSHILNSHSPTKLNTQQISRSEVKKQSNNNNQGQSRNNERQMHNNLSGSVFMKAVLDKKYSATEKKNHDIHNNLNQTMNGDKKQTFSTINRVEETFLRQPIQNSKQKGNLQLKRSQSPLTTQYNSRAKTPKPQTQEGNTKSLRKKSIKQKKQVNNNQFNHTQTNDKINCLSGLNNQIKLNTAQKSTQQQIKQLSRNKSTLNHNRDMNKTQVIKSKKQQIKDGNHSGWNKIENDQILQYIDDAWVNYRDKTYKLNTADKSKNEENEFTIDLQRLKSLKEGQQKRREGQKLSRSPSANGLQKNDQHNRSQLISSNTHKGFDSNLNYTSTKSKKSMNKSDYSSNSRSKSRSQTKHLQFPKFTIKPTTINHFTGQPLDDQRRDYTPTRSNTLFKKTFAMQQKEREKDQKFLDQYNHAFESIKFHQMAKNASPSQISTLLKRQSSQKKHENQLISMLDKNDNTKASKDLLIQTQTLLSRSQSPINGTSSQRTFKIPTSNREQQSSGVNSSRITNIVTKDFINKQNYTNQNINQDACDSYNSRVNTLNIKQTKQGLEPEFSFQKYSSEERSASPNDGRNQQVISTFQNYMRQNQLSRSPTRQNYSNSKLNDYTPAKLENNSTNIVRRTRAQRLKNPDQDKYSYNGGTSAQKRASELISNISPRVQELKRLSRMNSHRGSNRTSRAHSVKSSSRIDRNDNYQSYIPDSHIELQDDEDIAIANAQALMIRNMSMSNQGHDYNDSPLHISTSLTGTQRTQGSGIVDIEINQGRVNQGQQQMDTLLTKQKSMISRDEYRRQEEQKAKEELKRIKERHSPISSPNRRRKSGSPHNQHQRSKSPYLERNNFNLKINNVQHNKMLENEIYMSKFNQEVAEQLYKKHINKQQQSNNAQNIVVPRLKSDQLFGN